MTTIHLGDHETDCLICQQNCSCDKCEQDSRIKENLNYAMDNFEDYSFQDFEDIFEDRDPFEFL